MQDEIEAHPAGLAFGDRTESHPPLRGWLAARCAATVDGNTACYSCPTRPATPTSTNASRSGCGVTVVALIGSGIQVG
jgi:hypothetical protein